MCLTEGGLPCMLVFNTVSTPTEPSAMVERIDQTLTFYSTGLDAELGVPVEQDADLEQIRQVFTAIAQNISLVIQQLKEAFAPAVQQLMASFAASGLPALLQRQTRRRRLAGRWSDWRLRWDMIDMKRGRLQGRRW